MWPLQGVCNRGLGARAATTPPYGRPPYIAASHMLVYATCDRTVGQGVIGGPGARGALLQHSLVEWQSHCPAPQTAVDAYRTEKRWTS